MSCTVATPFTLEGVKYKAGQLLDESFPAGSVAGCVRTGLIVKLTEDETTATKAEYQEAANARKSQAQAKPKPADEKPVKKPKTKRTGRK